MKKIFVLMLVLSMIVGMTSLSSFAYMRNNQTGGGNYQNYQNGGMMNEGRSGSRSGNYGSMMNGNFEGQTGTRTRSGNYGGMMNNNFNGQTGTLNGNYDPSCINRFTGLNAGVNAGVNSANAISLDNAYAVGNTYLEKQLSTEYTLNKEGIATGDYYTFFVESNDLPVGRLSVNAVTSEVWVNSCRGLLQ